MCTKNKNEEDQEETGNEKTIQGKGENKHRRLQRLVFHGLNLES